MRNGRVEVNGERVSGGLVLVSPGDEIRVGTRKARVPRYGREEEDDAGTHSRTSATRRQPKVWLAHKLRGELVTTDDPKRRPTMAERFRQMGFHEIAKPVGRLDFNSEGLMVFTDCGDYARELELPSSRVPREYVVHVEGRVQRAWINSLRRGIRVDDVRYRPMLSADVLRDNEKGAWLALTLTEGKNREIRRIMEHMHLRVKRLIRVRYGPYELGEIPLGGVLPVSFLGR